MLRALIRHAFQLVAWDGVILQALQVLCMCTFKGTDFALGWHLRGGPEHAWPLAVMLTVVHGCVH